MNVSFQKVCIPLLLWFVVCIYEVVCIEDHNSDVSNGNASPYQWLRSLARTKQTAKEAEDDLEQELISNEICGAVTEACECTKRFRRGRRMHRRWLGEVYCREACFFPDWQDVRGRFGWACGGCHLSDDNSLNTTRYF